jgi:hypothetical protein
MVEEGDLWAQGLFSKSPVSLCHIRKSYRNRMTFSLWKAHLYQLKPLKVTYYLYYKNAIEAQRSKNSSSHVGGRGDRRE